MNIIIAVGVALTTIGAAQAQTVADLDADVGYLIYRQMQADQEARQTKLAQQQAEQQARMHEKLREAQAAYDRCTANIYCRGARDAQQAQAQAQRQEEEDRKTLNCQADDECATKEVMNWSTDLQNATKAKGQCVADPKCTSDRLMQLKAFIRTAQEQSAWWRAMVRHETPVDAADALRKEIEWHAGVDAVRAELEKEAAGKP